MKIVNSTTRDSTTDFETTAISELPDIQDISDKSLIHIVKEDGDSYESRKMKLGDFKQKIYEAVQNTFKTSYWDMPKDSSKSLSPEKQHGYDDAVVTYEDRTEPASFQTLVEFLGNDAPSPVDEDAIDGFTKEVFYDLDVLKRYVVKKDFAVTGAIEDFTARLGGLDNLFDRTMKMYTTFQDSEGGIETSQSSVNHTGNDNYSYCQMEIKPGNKISSEWTCPASGNLVVYGWLDSSDALNNKAIPSAFCVLEAEIYQPSKDVDSSESQLSSDASTLTERNWEIIGVQPVIPAKNITYVGFNAPVRKGLHIRARTGFTCGMKSGQHSNAQDGNDTLAMNVPNGFKCMVFANKDYEG